MSIKFTKMQGIGNDYIYINCFEGIPENIPELSKIMSPRHFSVGSDGIILICKSDIADAKMRIFNADGSEARMCGNGIRCVGKYLYDYGLVNKTEITVDTLSGIKYLTLYPENGKVRFVSVKMGKADFTPSVIPLSSDCEYIDSPITVNGEEWKITALATGNPHAVTFVDDVDSLDLEKIGPMFENHSLFPDRVNTEFVKVIGDNVLQMRVWERGSGETFACGTGACAVASAAVKLGICKPDTEINIKLKGGDLYITVSSDFDITMKGPAVTVYDGEWIND